MITGKIRISASARDGKEMFLNLMKPGDTFGEIALLDGHDRTASASATAPSELMIIMRDHFLALLQAEPALAIHLLQLLCQRICWTSGWAEDSALLAVPVRLARFLGLSRQVVNQHLQIWKVRGWVDLGRGKMTIVDGKAVQGIAAGT